DRDPVRASLPDWLRQPLRDHGRASLLIAAPSAARRAPTGCAARGSSRLGMVPSLATEGNHPMSKLSDTQAIILSAAAQRADGNVLPLPGSLRGGAATKVVAALLARGLIREHVIDSPRKADPALNRVWRNLDD